MIPPSVLLACRVVLGCNAAGFLLSAVLETHKLTDLVGAGSFAAASAALLAGLVADARESNADGESSLSRLMDLNPRAVVTCLLVIIWGVRLSLYLFVRVLRVGEDRRLRKFYREPGEPVLDAARSQYPVKLAGFWTIQSLWGMICSLPVMLVVDAPPTPLGYVSLAALGVAVYGLLLECIADWQKYRFRNNKANDGRWCDVGLWSVSRHPNYLGEIVFWWAQYVFALPALVAGGSPVARVLVAALSPAFITFLLLRVSGVPLLEKAADAAYKGDEKYQDYKRRTPVLCPGVY